MSDAYGKDGRMAIPDFHVQRANLPLFERRPEAWPLALMVDRLEEPLRALRIRALESQDEGGARTLLVASGRSSGEEYHGVEQDAQWLADRVTEMRLRAEGIASAVNVDLQDALQPAGTEVDPAAIDRFCADILQRLSGLLELERQIIGRRLNPAVEEPRLRFAGVTADVVSAHQDFVARMRQFLESGEGDRFEFIIDVKFDRLAAPRNGSVQVAPSPSSGPKPSRGSAAFAGCLIMIAAVIVGLLLPFPVVVVIVLVVWALWLVRK